MPYINIFADCHAERTAACNDPRARCDGPGSSMCVYRTEWSITKEPKCRHGMLNLSNPRGHGGCPEARIGGVVPFGPKGLVQRKGIAVTPNSWSKLRCLLCTKISRIGRSDAQAQRATASSFDSLKTSDGCNMAHRIGCTKTNHGSVKICVSHARWSALRGRARRSLILSFDRTVTAIKRLTNVRSMKCSKENETDPT